jgi:hypothetical protein
MRATPPPVRASYSAAPQQRHRNKPPKRGVDAADIPKVGVTAVRVDVFRHLSVRRLLCRESVERRDRPPFQHPIARAGHGDRAKPAISAEDARVSPGARPRRWFGSENPGGAQIRVQQLQRASGAVSDKIVSENSFSSWHAPQFTNGSNGCGVGN